jgi:Uma2 family endonuclease
MTTTFELPMTTTFELPPPDFCDPAEDQTMADLLDRLGGIPASRVRMLPTPGTATEEDAIAAESRYGRLCELVEGTLVEKPAGFYESIIAGIVGRMLGDFVTPRKLGIVAGEQGMMRVVPGRVRMPDVSFTSWSRVPADYEYNAAPRVSPDLAIEVLSIGNTTAEMDRKRAEYFAGGTRLVWQLNPRSRTMAVYVLGSTAPSLHADRVDGGDVLPGFTLDIADVFAQAERPPQS